MKKRDAKLEFGDRLDDLIRERQELLKRNGEKTDANLIAKEMEIASASLSKYRMGRGEPGMTNLLKIAKYFDVSVDYLLVLTEVKEVNPEKSAIAEKIGLSEESLDILIGLKNEKDSGDSKWAGKRLLYLDELISSGEFREIGASLMKMEEITSVMEGDTSFDGNMTLEKIVEEREKTTILGTEYSLVSLADQVKYARMHFFDLHRRLAEFILEQE